MKREDMLKQSKTIGYYLKRISKTISMTVDKNLSDIGLNVAQSNVLEYLEKNQGEEVNQVDIERNFQLTNPAVTKMLKKLEAKHLVERLDSSKDRRYKRICITHSGSELLKHAEAVKAPIELDIVNGFTEEETEHFLSYLKRLMYNVEHGSHDDK